MTVSRTIKPLLALLVDQGGPGSDAASASGIPSHRARVMSGDQADEHGWNQMVTAHPLGSVFQHTAFGKVVTGTFKHARPYYVALMDEKNHCCGGLTVYLVKSWLTGTRLVSVPFAFYGDPMVRSTGEFAALFRAVGALSEEHKASYVEIKTRNSAALLAQSNLMIPAYYYKTYTLDLTQGLDAVWKAFHRTSVRQKIRRAERSGIAVRSARSESEVLSFHALLCDDRRRLGLPPQKPEYFLSIWRHMVSARLAEFLLAEKDNELLGGLCTFNSNDLVYMGYIACKEAWRREGVGQVLAWAAMQSAFEAGAKALDIGKTSPHAEGLRLYKEHMGGIELDAPVFYFPRVRGISTRDDDEKVSYQLMRWFWKHVPPCLSKAASRFLYRHMG